MIDVIVLMSIELEALESTAGNMVDVYGYASTNLTERYVLISYPEELSIFFYVWLH
jgi:hypothetical protein